jgi:hypothetical protein
VEGIDLAHDGDQWSAVVNTMMNLRVPWNVGKCFCFHGISFIWWAVHHTPSPTICVMLPFKRTKTHVEAG